LDFTTQIICGEEQTGNRIITLRKILQIPSLLFTEFHKYVCLYLVADGGGL
jgi:hypothetical protein